MKKVGKLEGSVLVWSHALNYTDKDGNSYAVWIKREDFSLIMKLLENAKAYIQKKDGWYELNKEEKRRIL